MFPAFNQYPSMQWQGFQPQQRQQILPQQQIVQVSGPDSLYCLQMAANSSLLAMHQTAPIVYCCQSDGAGKITVTAYDIEPHKDEAVALKESVDARITALESTVTRLEEIINESNSAKHNEQ